MEAKAILYHSGEKQKCIDFINNSNHLIISNNKRDDIWLGYGMYFWDNKGNVTWWNKKQVARNIDREYSIVAVNAVLKQVLDLTDCDIYRMLEKLSDVVSEKHKEFDKLPLGNKLNILFEEYSFDKEYAIVKVYGKYNNTPRNGFFEYNPFDKKAEPTMAVKCIYSIRDARCIVEKDYVRS